MYSKLVISLITELYKLNKYILSEYASANCTSATHILHYRIHFVGETFIGIAYKSFLGKCIFLPHWQVNLPISLLAVLYFPKNRLLLLKLINGILPHTRQLNLKFKIGTTGTHLKFKNRTFQDGGVTYSFLTNVVSHSNHEQLTKVLQLD